MSGYTVKRIDDIERRDSWIPIRDDLGIGAFGINAFRADEAGAQVISDHTELMAKHEELYVVLEGRAAFTVDGHEIDAPAGTLVFVGDPESRRGAKALEAGTTVLVAGARPGEPYEVSPWEESWRESGEAMKLYREQRYAEAAAILRDAIERYPKSAGLYYNLACFESMAGEDAATVTGHLARSIELYPAFRDYARQDSDFEPVSDDPAFKVLLEESK
jgi:quercetin dioxygenase-like cupin family protein